MAIGQLLLERELYRVLCRYARACDERDWAAMAQVFTPACVADYGGHHCANRETIVAMIRAHLGGCGPSQHLLGNFLVDHSGAAAPSSRISVRAAHRGSGDRKALRYEALGDYLDHWVLTVEGWRIARRTMCMTLEMGDRNMLRPSP